MGMPRIVLNRILLPCVSLAWSPPQVPALLAVVRRPRPSVGAPRGLAPTGGAQPGLPLPAPGPAPCPPAPRALVPPAACLRALGRGHRPAAVPLQRAARSGFDRGFPAAGAPGPASAPPTSAAGSARDPETPQPLVSEGQLGGCGGRVSGPEPGPVTTCAAEWA